MVEIFVAVIVSLTVISIVWFTLKTGISPMPSSAKTRSAILKLSEQAPEGPVIDLGSGWGTLLFALARKYPDRQIIGYELSWLPYLFSCICKILFRMHHIQIIRADFLSAHLPETALLISYLHPQGMHDLKERLSQLQLNQTMLISSTFALPDSEAKQLLHMDDLYHTPIYLYQL